MAHTNIRVANRTHVDEQGEAGPYAEITAAVKRQLESHSQAMLKRMEEKSEQTIQDDETSIRKPMLSRFINQKPKETAGIRIERKPAPLRG